VRVLISGMGGELGTRVALLLEEQPWVSGITGMDVEPPRRRLRRSEFHRIDPRDRARTVSAVRHAHPDLVLHLGVYEPNARSSPRSAQRRTHDAAVNVLGAAAELPNLRGIVVRSGIEIYGRKRGAPTRPDEGVEPAPTSPFGCSLAEVEAVAAAAGRTADVPVTAVRCAPLVGPHFPSPLGRYLRLPVVPVHALADPPFSLLHQEDAARAFVAALRAAHDGPVNVVAPGAVTAFQAARLGGRVPLPLVGPEWVVARGFAELLGSPVPPHLVELLQRGRTADGSSCASLIGVAPQTSTLDVVKALYEWATVTHLRPGGTVAA
jgi:UDP-glucose 4-epimerase